MKTTELIMEKKARLDILESLFRRLENEEDDVRTELEWFDTDEAYLDDDGNPKTRADGTIKYKQDYRTIKKDDDKLSDEDRIRLTAIQTIRNQLEKMI